jgi:hypothetical protein
VTRFRQSTELYHSSSTGQSDHLAIGYIDANLAHHGGNLSVAEPIPHTTSPTQEHVSPIIMDQAIQEQGHELHTS